MIFFYTETDWSTSDASNGISGSRVRSPFVEHTPGTENPSSRPRTELATGPTISLLITNQSTIPCTLHAVSSEAKLFPAVNWSRDHPLQEAAVGEHIDILNHRLTK